MSSRLDDKAAVVVEPIRNRLGPNPELAPPGTAPDDNYSSVRHELAYVKVWRRFKQRSRRPCSTNFPG